ncbi:penicillin-binding protein 2 [Thermosyntropha sp.]|uniref:peptidoglycan D,D-transpeptidase FtsI family protein n=1 Tax=Thermosyntropha sp. TaxID=2740820 RepID=UPI0025F57A26|nr:penicillin-binding protein 2 [Thermosyntropha sp.]MBO8159805.1 penicillin-binding protein 2 [Thermosyntropha sp.]
MRKTRIYRIFILMCIFLFVFMGLLFRIAYCQLFKGYQLAAEANAMRSRQIELKEYKRGEIFDRNFLPLTSIQSVKALYCLPAEIIKNYPSENKSEAISEIAAFLASNIRDKDYEEIYGKLYRGLKEKVPFVCIAADLSEEEMRRINSYAPSGIVVAPLIKRYRDDGFCCHVLGFASMSENKGLSGIEYVYNDVLTSYPFSEELVSVLDARGQAIQGLMFKVKREENKNKAGVVLTIDKRVQQIAEEIADKKVKKGAVVVMDVNSKEILALVSRPKYNSYEIGKIKNDNENSPLINRALAPYHPGSMFKILIAAAALEYKTVSAKDKFYCSGEYRFSGGKSISCWKKEGHKLISFADAFANSCNSAFIEVALQLGRDKIINFAQQVHLPEERIIGYKTEDNSYIKIDWADMAVANAALGQQGVMLSPVQIASLISTIADDGYFAPPVLVKYWIDKKGIKHLVYSEGKKRVMKEETAKEIRHMMRLVVTKGTGKNAEPITIKAAGKTATSQTGRYKNYGEEIVNTWFGGFFPLHNPRFAIVVLVEEGESGAVSAAPVFKEIAEAMLKFF